MTAALDRRFLLKAAGALALASTTEDAAEAQDLLKFGAPRPFSYERLKDMAKRMAGEPYVGPKRPSPEIIAKIDYEAWGKIKFKMDHALFANGPQRFPVSFFHLGMFFAKAVEMNVVANGEAREIIYDQSYFDMPDDSVAKQLPQGAGFAGLRVQEARDGKLDWKKNDWVAFLGAAYFRSIGELFQYGLSARAIALDVAVADRAEEFPDFTKFFIDSAETGNTITIYALLEGASIVGACKFRMERGKAVIMDIEQSLHLRADITRFGLAPLTSMFWFSETVKPTGADWRPEVHDSDGLAMWTGAGEHLWRPLNNPPRIVASAFLDENPRGFGLLQRDRNFDHYQDGVFYDKRPSLWVEPHGQWGKGAIHLVEIPTDDEIHDNIVAMWVPEAPAVAGTNVDLAYRLYWAADEPFPTPLARCVATRIGKGGQPGKPRPTGVRKFMVEFLGGNLATLPFGVKPEPALWASRGTFSYVFTEAVPDGVKGHWRAQFDLTVTGADPVEMRLQLKVDGKIASETWLFQYHPF
jgi:periplasmic glucans biosynthesis protein